MTTAAEIATATAMDVLPFWFCMSGVVFVSLFSEMVCVTDFSKMSSVVRSLVKVAYNTRNWKKNESAVRTFLC